jgi:hypothetical protein
MKPTTNSIILANARDRLKNRYFPLNPSADFMSVRRFNYGNVEDVLFTPSGSYPGSTAISGGVLLPDGRVFCVSL